MSDKTVQTTWELWSYDVWGNSEDGYEVNDRSCFDRDYVINCKIEHNNANLPALAFDSASPSDYQIKKAFGVSCAIETNGDDTHITIDRASDGYPLGEMYCTSHASLSPVRN
jgi:hypothetical protein